MYHTFPDLNLQGIYDMGPHLFRYHFPDVQDKLVLELGCASGYFSRQFYLGGAHVVAYDINVEATKKVQELSGTKIHIFEKDVFDLNHSNRFDMVFCGSLLMHVFYPVYLLKIVRKALKPDGLFVCATAGIESDRPIIQCEPHQGRLRSFAEKEISSSNQSLWWFSKSAIVNTFATVGFKNVRVVDQFDLESTDYGKSIGHNFKTMHFVVHAEK